MVVYGIIGGRLVLFGRKEIIQIRADIKDVDERVSQLEDSNKWLVRTAGAAIITAIVGVVFVLIRMGAGL